MKEEGQGGGGEKGTEDEGEQLIITFTRLIFPASRSEK